MTGKEDTDQSLFLCLPLDAILLILTFCDLPSLGRLSATCRRLREVVSTEIVWLPRCRRALFSYSNNDNEFMFQRNCCRLTAKEKCGISFNWIRNIHRCCLMLRNKTRYMPWLQLNKERLWLSLGDSIIGSSHPNCMKSGSSKPFHTLHGHGDDVSRFVVKHGLIIGAVRDGSVLCWNEKCGTRVYQLKNWHDSDVLCVDVGHSGQLLVTGSRDHFMKVGSFDENLRLKSQSSLDFGDRVLSLCTNDEAVFLGTAGCTQSTSPLFKVDLSRCEIIENYGFYKKFGAGILDMFLDTNLTILSCGHDSSIRLWDTRIGQCVKEWEDPYDSAVYCVASDHNNMVMSGTSRHGLVRLWDKRMNRCLQMYFVGKTNSPVYSVAFDPCHMFVALDTSLHSVSFKGNGLKRHQSYL